MKHVARFVADKPGRMRCGGLAVGGLSPLDAQPATLDLAIECLLSRQSAIVSFAAPGRDLL
jgi:hypothetical protein